ncbi:MAG: N-acyl homoserine lactonase family protein [Myxococcaceae bacterium]|nr:MAG: N-acyl homoserine lactonase family protein [Myxococcaceae bacterium]
MWELHPLYFGEWPDFEKSRFTYNKGFGEKIRAIAIGYLLKNGDRTVLVDAGIYDEHRAITDHDQRVINTGAERVRIALAEHDIEPEDISDVFITHLHWDHAANLPLFTNAQVHIQADEIKYAEKPLPPHQVSFDYGMSEPAPWTLVRDRINVLDGDTHIAPGLDAFYLPGHTPGSQGIRVETAKASYLLAGDNVDLYENWEGDELLKHRPGLVFVSMTDYWNSLERMEGLADVIVPSHDPLVFEQGEF